MKSPLDEADKKQTSSGILHPKRWIQCGCSTPSKQKRNNSEPWITGRLMHPFRLLLNTSMFNKILYFVLRRSNQNMSYKSQRSRSVPSVWECEDYQIIFVGCWRCFNGPEIRSEQFVFPRKRTDSPEYGNNSVVWHTSGTAATTLTVQVADTSARRDPNQGDVRKRRGFNCSVGGGFSSLLPCPLILSDSVLVLAYGNGGLQFLWVLFPDYNHMFGGLLVYRDTHLLFKPHST